MLLDKRTYTKSQIHLESGLDQRTLDACLKLFLLSCKVENLSPFTIRNYRQKVGMLVAFLNGIKITKPKQVKLTHIRLFLLKRQETCHSVAIHNNYRAIKRFFNWMVEERILKESPLLGIHFRKPQDKIIEPFRLEHIRDLLSLCDDSKFLGTRNKAVILTFLDTGLRLNELINIDLKDLNFERETIKVMGKGQRERLVRMGKNTQKALLRYLLMRNDQFSCLWVSEERKPLTYWGIELMIRKLGKLANFNGVRCSPHTFRHTFGTQAMLNGATEREVQLLLGHSTDRMTKRYTATITSENVLSKHRQFSPVDALKLK